MSATRADWSWKPDAYTRKCIDDGNKKIRTAQRNRAIVLSRPKPKTGESK